MKIIVDGKFSEDDSIVLFCEFGCHEVGTWKISEADGFALFRFFFKKEVFALLRKCSFNGETFLLPFSC
jgi:hypothetical protein